MRLAGRRRPRSRSRPRRPRPCPEPEARARASRSILSPAARGPVPSRSSPGAAGRRRAPASRSARRCRPTALSRGSRSGQLAQVAVDDAGALAALVDRPHDQRLAAAGVAGGEHALGRGRVGARLGVAALVALDAERLEQRPARGCRKPIASSTSSAGCDSSVPSIASNGGLPAFCDPVHLLDAAVAGQLGGGDREVALAALLEGVGACAASRASAATA